MTAARPRRTSVVVALADKIDTLVGFFAIDEKPTGSKDPYALRRAALGIIRLILENKLRLRLGDAFGAAFMTLGDAFKGTRSEFRAEAKAGLVSELLSFFADRLKVHLREQGVRHDLIAAVFAPRPGLAPQNPLPQAGEGTAAPGSAEGEDDLVRLLARVAALDGFLKSEDGANLLVAYRRASNIVRIEEKKDGRSYDALPEADSPADAAGARARRTTGGGRAFERCSPARRRNLALQWQALAQLRRPVDEFFSAVTVNCEDAKLRTNRLRLLSQIRATLNRVADFSQIEG